MSETCRLCQSLCSLGMTVNLRGLVGDCGKEFVMPDCLQCWQCLCGVCGQGVWRKKTACSKADRLTISKRIVVSEEDKPFLFSVFHVFSGRWFCKRFTARIRLRADGYSIQKRLELPVYNLLLDFFYVLLLVRLRNIISTPSCRSVKSVAAERISDTFSAIA